MTKQDWLIYGAMALGLALVFGGLMWYAHARRKWIRWKKAYLLAHPSPPSGTRYTSDHLRMLYDREQERIRLEEARKARERAGKKLDPKGREVDL